MEIQITSPLGRTGMTGPVRIVARVMADPRAILSGVYFFVDGAPVGEDHDGPPYAVEWEDANPFEERKIEAAVTDSLGGEARDRVVLEPLELFDTTEVSSVLLEPLVLDAEGRPVNGLTEGDFYVTENGEPQEIELAIPDTLPAVYTLLIDSSQSMSRRMSLVRDAARRLPDYLRAHDRVTVVPFAATLGTVTGPTQDNDTIADAISAINAKGGTAILDSLNRAASQLPREKERQIVVLITDGYDENSDLPFEQALEGIREARATVYVIAIGGVAGISLQGEELLRRLSTETGGRAFFPSRDVQLADMHRLIADDVQQRYVVSYTPTNQRLDGAWRAIDLTTSNPEHTVRARPGYYSPAPPPIRPQIELTIRDTNNEYLDVTPEDFEVLEDGELQIVEAFQEAIAPVSVVLALDASGSMRRDEAAVVAAAESFVTALPDKDRLAVMTFADVPEVAHDLTTLRPWSLDAIGQYQAIGGTALYDSVVEAMTLLRRADGRTALVVLTDGRDEDNPGTGPGSRHTLDQALASIQEVGATIYPIGLGPNVDRETLERFAISSGGHAYFPADVSQLADDYHRILENIRRRYVLSYSSTNGIRDGAWRAVEIRPTRDGLIIETRGGYFAPVDQ